MQIDSTSQLSQPKSGNRRTHWVERKNCAWCGIEMVRTPDIEPWRFDRNKCCSAACSEKARRANNPRRLPDATKSCVICGATFDRAGRNGKAWERVKTCSQTCKGQLIGQAKRVDRNVVSSRACEICGSEMVCGESEEPNQFQRRQCCSEACARLLRSERRKAQSTIELRNCKVCGKQIEPRPDDYPSTYALRETCGTECSPRSRWVNKDEWRIGATKMCSVCGEDFAPRMNEAQSTFKKRQTCGVDCGQKWAAYLNWRRNHKGMEYSGRAAAYPSEWATVRLLILRRDRYRCQMCRDTERKKHVHHIDYDKQNCEHTNLITLCDRCHGRTSRANREIWADICRGFLKVRGIL